MIVCYLRIERKAIRRRAKSQTFFQSNTVFAEFANLEALENAKLKLNGLALGGETLSAESAKSNRNIATDIEMDR